MADQPAAAPATASPDAGAAPAVTAPAAPAAAAAPAVAPVTPVVAPAALAVPAAPAAPAAPAPAAGSPEAIAAEKAATEAAATAKAAARDVAIKAGVLEVAPEKYEDFKMPDGVTVDAKILTEFQPVLKELGLPQAAAQKVVDFYASKVLPHLAQAQTDAVKAQDESWTKAVKEDKELGGDKLNENLEIAKTTLTKFGSPELVKLLNASRLGNHPEVVRLFNKIGRAMQEDSISGAGGGGAATKDAASILYPDMK